MSRFKPVIEFIKDLAQEIVDDDVLSMAGSIAYFTLLSLPPLLALLVALTGFFVGNEAVEALLTDEVGATIGEGTGEQLAAMIESARDVGAGSLTGQIIGLVALVVAASGAFGQLQKSLNRAWGVMRDPEQGGIKNFIVKRLFSFGMILALGFLLAASFVLSAVVQAIGTRLGDLLSEAGWVVIQVADIALPLLLFAALFGAMFKILPDAEIAWRNVWVGGLVTALLFVVGKFAIGLYVGRSELADTFGAAGAVIAILIWIYYTALLLLVGAEFTQLWAERQGTEIQPSAGAVRIETKSILHPPEEAPDSPAHPVAEPRKPQPRDGVYPDST